MDAEQLRVLLGNAHELRDVEVKSAGPYEKASGFTGRVIRAMLGMSNLRDGGTVVLGIDETQGGGFTPVGLTDEDLATWDADTLATLLSNYADPSVQFTLHKIVLDGVSFVVIEVEAFEESPTLCKKPFQAAGNLILREGALYVRSRRKRETAEISTSEDMRELLRLAVEKQLADYVARGQRAGLFGPASHPPAGESDLYAAERSDLE